jgi:hypothetical protein
MTKSFAASLILVLSASLAFSVQQPVGWITYASPNGRFNVELPRQPDVSTQEANTAEGEKFPQYLVSAEGDGVVFLIGYFDAVPGTVFSANLARDGMLKSAAGILTGESAISLGGYSGHAYNISLKLHSSDEPATEIDYVDRARIYEADKRIYVLQVIFPKAREGEVDASATKFFDSFQVVKT